MCIAYQEAYVGCDHVKATVFIERCGDAENDSCNGADGITVIWIKQLSEPSLCVNCYRSQEAEIFVEYEANIAYHNDEIKQLEERAKKAPTETTRDLLRIAMAEHEKTRDKKIGFRTERLQLFREGQGVWGDG